MNNERSIVLPINIDFREPGQVAPWSKKPVEASDEYNYALTRVVERIKVKPFPLVAI